MSVSIEEAKASGARIGSFLGHSYGRLRIQIFLLSLGPEVSLRLAGYLFAPSCKLWECCGGGGGKWETPKQGGRAEIACAKELLKC